jgi:3-oxoacyl-[acyl-carrier-protein] synthase II
MKSGRKSEEAPLSKRVVITGLGLVSPIGIGVDEALKSLRLGRSGVSEITRFDASGFQTRIAAEVKDFRIEDFLSKKEAKRSDLFIAYALAATQMALDDSGLVIDKDNGRRIGVMTGCGLGGLDILENNVLNLYRKGPNRISPFFIPLMIGNMAAGMISMRFGATGPNTSLATACAAGAHAVGDSFRAIQQGRADAMITGGVEAVVRATAVAGFGAMKALSVRNDEPEKASRPFDRERDGFVLGEGSGILILEDLEHARQRGATIYAEVVGYGMTGDGYHMTAPPPDGNGAVRCMLAALDDAGLRPEDIDYINAHGTSTQLNDESETQAIKDAFGEHAYHLAVSSTKSMTGHLLGGAGGLETVFTALAVHHGLMPPTINYEYPDPACDLDYVPNHAREADIHYAMSNSFGFGGTNAVLVLAKHRA